MKKALLAVLLVAAVAAAYAVFTNATLDFAYDGTGVNQISGGCYNYVTSHYYACDYQAGNVDILNQDGTDSGSNLSVSGITLGDLNIFNMCATSDGVIYGGANTPDTKIIRWANEAANPTEQTITGLLLPRVIDCKGIGVDTIIASTGGADDDTVRILTTTDGSTYAITDETVALGKQGVAVAADGLVAFAGQGYTGNLPRKAIKSGGVWAEDTTTFDPSADPNAADLQAPCAMGYNDEGDLLFCCDTIGDATTDQLHVLDGTTGAILQSLVVGLDLGPYSYGKVDNKALSDTEIEVRFIVRGTGAITVAGWIAGKATVTGSGFLPTPTPTPTPVPTAAGTKYWKLFE